MAGFTAVAVGAYLAKKEFKDKPEDKAKRARKASAAKTEASREKSRKRKEEQGVLDENIAKRKRRFETARNVTTANPTGYSGQASTAKSILTGS